MNKIKPAVFAGVNAVLCIAAAAIGNAFAFIPCVLSLAVTAAWLKCCKKIEKDNEKLKNNKTEKAEFEHRLSEEKSRLEKRYYELYEEYKTLLSEKNEMLKYAAAPSQHVPPKTERQKSNEQEITEKFNAALSKGGNALYRFVSAGTNIGKSGDKWRAVPNGWLAGIEDNGIIYAYPVVDVASGENLRNYGVLEAFAVDRTDFGDRETMHIGGIYKAAGFVRSGDEFILKEKGKMSLR